MTSRQLAPRLAAMRTLLIAAAAASAVALLSACGAPLEQQDYSLNDDVRPGAGLITGEDGGVTLYRR